MRSGFVQVCLYLLVYMCSSEAPSCSTADLRRCLVAQHLPCSVSVLSTVAGYCILALASGSARVLLQATPCLHRAVSSEAVTLLSRPAPSCPLR